MLYVNEIFYSIQGEGVHTGKPAVFVRMQGCNVHCSFCDTKNTWKLGTPNEKPISFAFEKRDCAHYASTDLMELLAEIGFRFPEAKFIVITGGEPCLQNLYDFIRVGLGKGYTIAIETSGTAHVNVPDGTWVTVSPKINQEGGLKLQPSALVRANEIKHVVKTMDDVLQLEEHVLPFVKPDCVICLQPMSCDEKATELCVELCKKRNWRLSLQTHKFVGVR